jgi:hypothetical protein
MPRAVKAEPTHTRESSFVSLLSGWVQQGVENFFATQRILVDLATRQNASAMNFVRDQMADSTFCPMTVFTELAGEGMTNFIEGQKLLLNLAQKEYELVTNGVKERVGGFPPAVAATDFLRRGYDTFVEMQLDFLKIASKQTHTWLAAVKTGKGFDTEGLVEAARDSFDTFVRSQKKFLEVVVEETTNATAMNGTTKKMKKTELVELAREATDSFVDAQKKLLDLAAKQMNAQLNATEHTLSMIPASPFAPIPDLTRHGVKSFIEAEKALMDTVTKRRTETKTATTVHHKKRPARTIKMETGHTHAHA